MTRATRSQADDMIADLSRLGEMRVWSVIITIFGDAVVPRGGVLPSVLLREILERMSIRPEAMRVALHRLVKDGWIVRTKSGRQSYYVLSENGRAEFLPATRRIYAKSPELSGPWTLVVPDPGSEGSSAQAGENLMAKGSLELAQGVFLQPNHSVAADQGYLCATVSGNGLPDWARQILGPRKLAREYEQLLAVLQRHQIGADWAPADCVALRSMLVHAWRRILVRHADLPPDALPTDWPGETCRKTVLALHSRLSKHADPWLDAALEIITLPRE